MIYTITLNPSIDHYIFLQKETNRASRTADLCGGKGINISLVCAGLGISTVCTGFYGGFTGDELIRQLNEHGIDHKFVRIKGNTRINTKIVYDGRVTEINACSPEISEEESKELLSILSAAKSEDTAVLSGSVPKSQKLLKSVIEVINDTGARFIADTSGDALNECIRSKPYLIKPNRSEIAAYFGIDADNLDIPEYANKLVNFGIKNVIVSDGERGAYFADKNGCRYLPVKDAGYKAKNATGAGDSMIAGYLYGEQNGTDSFISAVSAGSASAYSEGLFEKNIFYNVIKSYFYV